MSRVLPAVFSLCALAAPWALGDDEAASEAARRQIENRKGKIRAYLEVLKEEPDSTQLRLDVARACLELAELGAVEVDGESVVHLAKDQAWLILTKEPEHQVARGLVVLLENHKLPPLVGPEEEAPEALLAAQAAFEAGDPAAAQAELDALPTPPAAALLYRGACRLLLWDLAGAREALAAILEKRPRDPHALRYFAKCDEREGKFEGARDGYLRAIVEAPDLESAWQDLAWVARHAGQEVRRTRLAKLATVREGEGGRLSIVLATSEKNPVTDSWLVYAATRAKWRKETFAARFPAAKEYVHTFAEEREAWEKALGAWRHFQSKANGLTDPDLDRLGVLAAGGHLAAFVYVEEHDPAFREALGAEGGVSRDAVRLYLQDVVLVPRGQ
ncbi:MAG: hypothetical protein HY720_05185 [Planctomycetes bacterium]|nr:hypothetical protein [Planctomycetota bacterium]